jgi:hypothetical protein
MTVESAERNEETESKTRESVPTPNPESVFTQNHTDNLERRGNSDISAAVSPRTTPQDTQVQRLVTPVVLDHDDQGPLTATRVPMDIDKGINDHLGIHNSTSDSSTANSFYQTATDVSMYNHAPDPIDANENMIGAECVGLTGHSNSEDMKQDIHMLNMYTSAYQNVQTPLQTPQLSSTTMSTPQIDTPEHSLPTYGLGVHIPTTGMDMHFGAQNLLNQHTMAGITHSLPMGKSNSIQTNISPTSQPRSSVGSTSMSTNTPSDFHARGHNADLDMHKLDSFPNIEIPGATSSSPYSMCSAPTGHGMSGISDEMLTGIDVSMSMALDMENGGTVAHNAMALHPFTWV